VKREAEERLGAPTKRSPVAGAAEGTSPRRKVFLGAKAGGPGIVVCYFAVLFVHFFLLLAGLTGFRLLLLLLGRLLRTAALLLLLVTLICHSVLSLLKEANDAQAGRS
jgi:hypothetical protein